MTALFLVIGLGIVAGTGSSMLATFVMPRGRAIGLRASFFVNQAVRLALVFVARPLKSLRRKDAVLATIAPLALLCQLVAFLASFLLGYSIALTPFASSFPAALELASSELFTAGLAHVALEGEVVIQVMAAVTGAIAIALQIGYLPAIYQAFNRRESLVTLMEARAGLPPWGPELLLRHELVASLDALPALYSRWELWSADLAESHVSYPILLYFRSPELGYSYALSQLAILDAAAMHLSLMPESAPSEARFCLRMGFTALRRIADTLGWRYEKDPQPTDDLSLSYEEFAYAVELVRHAGLPLERSTEDAWPHFKAWRVNYEAIAYRLADYVVAPHAPWSGDRRHLSVALQMPERPPHRSPGGGLVIEDERRPGSQGLEP